MTLWTQKVFMISILFSFSSFGLSSPSHHFIDDAIKFEINSKGFEVLSDIIYESNLKNPTQTHIEHYTYSIPLLTQIDLHDIHLTPSFKELSIHPNPDNSLSINLSLEKLKIDINEIRATLFNLPFFTTTCPNMKGSLNDLEQSPIEAKLTGAVEDGHVKLSIEDFNVDLSKARLDFEASNPSCELGTENSYRKNFFEWVLKYTRPFLLRVIQYKFRKEVLKLALELEEIINMSIPINTPDFIMIPEASLNLKFHPNFINISGTKLDVAFDLEILNQETDPSSFLNKLNFEEFLRFSKISINTNAINTFIEKILENGSIPFELSPSLHEDFSDFLDISRFSDFLPDLESARFDVHYLKAQLTLDESPSLKIYKDEEKVKFAFPKLAARLLVKQDGAWIPYFKLNLEINFDSSLQVDEGIFNACIPRIQVTLDGKWDESYQPENPQFNGQVLQESLNEFLGITVEDCPITHELKPFDLVGKKISIEKIEVENPFIILHVDSKPDHSK